MIAETIPELKSLPAEGKLVLVGDFGTSWRPGPTPFRREKITSNFCANAWNTAASIPKTWRRGKT